MDNIEKEKWNCKENQFQLIEKALNNEYLKILAPTFKVTTNLRNDYNHAGMRSNPAKRTGLISNLKERLEKILLMIEDQTICS